MTIDISPDFGYCLCVGVGFYLHQQLVLILPVIKARMRCVIPLQSLCSPLRLNHLVPLALASRRRPSIHAILR